MSKNLKQASTKGKHKIRTKTRFYKPRTRKTVSVPKTLKSFKSEIRRKENKGLEYHDILIQPVSSDKNMMLMEN